MSFHDKNRYNTFYKMDVADPRNLMVDANDVFDVFVNNVYDKKANEKDIQVAHKK
jgi:hypothetical protein